MDWNLFLNSLGTAFIGGLAGGSIALIGNLMANKNQIKLVEKQLNEQNDLFEKEKLYKKENDEEILLNKKKEAATILYYLIPEIAWEGFQFKKSAINYPSMIFSNFDFINALNILRGELEKEEMLYMIKLFANIEAIKTASPGSTGFNNSYYQFLCGFSNGYENCGNYYYRNIQNSKSTSKMPIDNINDCPLENRTKDYMMELCYSNFINKSENQIYTKLEKIKDRGTLK